MIISALSKTSAISEVQTSCPFVEGLAVYKARLLWAMWEPNAIIDDRVICAQGQNKNGDNTNIDEYILNNLKELTSIKRNNNLLQGNALNSHKLKNIEVKNSKIKLYPNPASTQIIIEYQSTFDGQFVLFNSLGEIVLQTTLSKEMTKTQMTINDVANGLYHYEINFADNEKVIGKLSILK
jgi:hypothetical protein